MLVGSLACAFGCLFLGTELVSPTPPDRTSGVPFGAFFLLLGGLLFLRRRFVREPSLVSDFLPRDAIDVAQRRVDEGL